MPVTKTWAGGTFNLPLNREPKGSWGTEVSNFLISLANNALALTGGTQTLSAELNFGATYGLVSAYVKSASANIASSGMLRLAKGDSVAWRNNANGADLALGVNASDRLTFGGVAIPTISSTDTLTSKTIVVASNTVTTAASGNLAATELNAALSELQTDIDTRATSATVTAHTGASSGVHGVTGNVVGTTDAQALTNKTISGTSNTLTVRLANDVTGTLPIANGGTGQTAKTAAYNALTPVTTKGDIVGSDGTNGVRVAVGADGTVLSADSSQTAGLKWVSPLTNPMTTQGDLIVGGSSGAATRLAAGTNGQRLKTAGSGATPTYGWESTVTKTANYTITDTDGYDIVLGDATSGNVTITLPAAANNSGRKLVIKKIDSSTNTVAISGTIDGGTSNNTIKQQYGWGAVVSNGTSWYWVSDIQETGAWSPSLALSGSNPSGASSTGTWSYSRNGRIVTVQFYINFTALGSGGAGNLNYSGLPFTSRNPGSASWIGAVATNAVASLTNKFIVAAVSNNSAVLSFSYGGSSASSVSWSEISTGVWYTTVTYFIA